MTTFRCIVMGAAGRDFHDFQTFFRSHPEFRVCCFTATQIPFIERRSFPRELAGEGYPEDIPIYPEARLAELVERYEADFVFLSYSDLAYDDVMHKASVAQAAGASFALLGPRHTVLESRRPVLSVTAVRTGAGKSPIAQAIASHLAARGLRVGVIRHPMPYGDLRRHVVQRFGSPSDLDEQECTLEEREEYAPYVARGLAVFAGVDYRRVLVAAEAESDVILWDGGNNDRPFIRPGLSIVVADALRPGHEKAFYPGETNARAADVFVINKVGEASADAVLRVRDNARELCPDAAVIEADLEVEVADPGAFGGRRVLVVEDGPSLTHGGMASGAGALAAHKGGAAELIDPRAYAVGTVAEAYRAYPHIGPVLPALGYSDAQRNELRKTILAASPDVVLDASPANLGTVLDLPVPVVRVTYTFRERSGPNLFGLVDAFLKQCSGVRPASVTDP